MIPARAYPLSAKLVQSLFGETSLEDLADEVSEEHPADTSDMPGVIMLDRDRAKVTAPGPTTTLEHEWKRIAGHRSDNEATLRYVLSDVLATPFGLYSARSIQRPSGRSSLRALLGADIHRAARGFYSINQVAMNYFGHWVHDALPTSLLRAEGEALFLPTYDFWPHTTAYAQALDLDRLPHDFVHFETLTLVRDIGMNASRRARIAGIRARVQAVLPPPGPGRVYLSRGATGAARLLLNEAEVISALEARGFTVVNSADPLPVLWAALSGASQVVTVEGSQWAHAAFAMAQGALFVTLNPADRFTNVAADYMAALETRMATTVMSRAGAGYRADVAALCDLLDRA